MRYLFLYILLIISSLSFAQPVIQPVVPPTNTTTGKPQLDNVRGQTPLDTLLAQADGVTPDLRADSTAPQVDSSNITFSKENVEDPVEYNAQDSMIYDIPNQKVYLYGKASVKQKTMEMKAHFIIIDNKTNTVAAEGKLDGKGEDKGRCSFKDGEQDIIADRIKFNFKTKKGKVYNTKTKQNENDYIQSEENKFVGKDPSVGRLDDIAYGKNALMTTCNADEPHFGILSTKQKVISGKLVVAGPSTIVVGGVPTPVVLPFAFFPITKGRRGGFLMPNNYDLSISRGIGLQGLGWYFPISDNMDLQVRGDIYTRGTWRVGMSANYIKRYASAGSFSLNYANNQVGEQGTKDYVQARDFQLSWSHRQDAKAHPKQSFSASVNLGTATVLRNNYNDAQNVLNNTLSSNINYSRTLTDNGMTFNAGFTHSQNTQNRAMDITLPRASFAMPAVFPFKRKVQIGNERWYEKLNFNYSSEFQTRLSTTDTTLFKGDWETLKNQIHSGMTHNIPVSVPLKLKNFNISPNMSYRENWYFTTTRKDFDTSYIKTRTVNDKIVRDTGRLTETTRFGFDALREFNAGVAVSTNLYGLMQIPNKGAGLRAIRHAVTPNLSFNYSPDNKNLAYTDSIYTTPVWRRKKQGYNYMERAPYGFLSNGRQNTISLVINNSFQAKFAKRQADSTFKMGQPITLLNANINANYNLAADSLRLSVISTNFNTTIFKYIGINGGFVLDPYEKRHLVEKLKTLDNKTYYNVSDKRMNTFRFDADRRIVNFVSANISANAGFSGQQLTEIFGSKKPDNNANPNANQNAPAPQTTKQQPFISQISAYYNLQYSSDRTKNGTDTLRVLNDISINGSLNLTNNWRFDVGRIGYNFTDKRITFPDFTIYRNLHCWEMGMSWQPERDTYTFFLRAKPGTLDFMKVPFNKNRLDPVNF